MDQPIQQRNQTFQRIQEAIVALDSQELSRLTDDILQGGFDPLLAIEEGYTPGIKRIGQQFERGQLFLPELVRAGNIVREALALLQERIPQDQVRSKGRFLIGTVEGDIHNIGKDLVATMLANSGFEVIDIGVNCPASKFIDTAIAVDADIIGASCLLTLTMPQVANLLDEIRAQGLRERFKVMVGGACVDPSFVLEVGADGTGADLKEAVDVALALVGRDEEES